MLANHHKIIIYQTLVRCFGNKTTKNTYYGSITENGCGKFNDISHEALSALKEFGVDYVWYTGVIEHASMTDYADYAISIDDPDVVKGIAGSPYAIKDYYDVAPDLAVDVCERMAEFESLIKRTHALNMKVLMDFIPNHVARTYFSDVKPTNVKNFGEHDNAEHRFDANNDFYYIPNESFIVPEGYNPGGDTFVHPLKDGKFEEFPAKATGNNVFSATPSIDDWFETIKLNYGVDIESNEKHFVPQPPVWKKMRDILAFWAKKGVNGFRCDMVELVPVEFWNWVITDLKKKFPDLIFIGEAYNRDEYRNFLFNGKFDYLYDKVGLYDGLKRLIMADHGANVADISFVCKAESSGFSERMLRFLENHDETRIASSAFAGDPWLAVPGMVVTATLASGPLMIYNGQEVGEPAKGAQGFSGDDGRSSIFDYCGLPQHQKWMNNGAFDGGQLDENTKNLRNFYAKLIHVSKSHEAILQGDCLEVFADNNIYAYVRYTQHHRVLIVANFSRFSSEFTLHLPAEMFTSQAINFTDLLTGTVVGSENINDGLRMTMPATSAGIFEF
ncbi:MAG: alpha-amylase family glycosyl hydrolase [Bacteroidia bacterium]